MKKKIILMLVFTIFLISCSPSLEKQCTADSDCVPAACCHATDAVNKDNAPDCAGILCSMSCEPDTLDCGQGEIKCVSEQCTVTIK